MWYIQGVTELYLSILYSLPRETLLYLPLAEQLLAVRTAITTLLATVANKYE
jgi:hypothetical protein